VPEGTKVNELPQEDPVEIVNVPMEGEAELKNELLEDEEEEEYDDEEEETEEPKTSSSSSQISSSSSSSFSSSGDGPPKSFSSKTYSSSSDVDGQRTKSSAAKTKVSYEAINTDTWGVAGYYEVATTKMGGSQLTISAKIRKNGGFEKTGVYGVGWTLGFGNQSENYLA